MLLNLFFQPAFCCFQPLSIFDRIQQIPDNDGTASNGYISKYFDQFRSFLSVFVPIKHFSQFFPVTRYKQSINVKYGFPMDLSVVINRNFTLDLLINKTRIINRRLTTDGFSEIEFSNVVSSTANSQQNANVSFLNFAMSKQKKDAPFRRAGSGIVHRRKATT